MLQKILLVLMLGSLLALPTTPGLAAPGTGDNALDARQKAIVLIGAFTAQGNMEQLRTALAEGLDAGLTVNEIKEILVQLYAYAGFPRSLNAINAFMAVMRERHDKGITDMVGKEASPLPEGKSNLELGTEIQTKLVGEPVKGEIYDFAPAIDAFLKAHLFGDIFGRNNLDYASREIATIAALASMQGVNAQLRSHFRVGMRVGLSADQLKSLLRVLETRVGQKEAANAAAVLGDVLDGKSK
uniref:Uncharacterized protein, gamma-carboxymuconolactone decarboxylase subunit like protein n=1 Tax=Desulfovibrio sp. U5L TaxID=596152 RepID=I2Q4E8_9BACT